MTSPPDRLRAAATDLPDVEEASIDGACAFSVSGRVFATLTGDTLRLLRDGGFEAIDLAADPDWASIDDRVARSWEFAAPGRLLEAGGR